MDIKCRFTGKVLFSYETDSLTVCVEMAFKARAYLEGAYLADANLARANLEGANLARANLAGANLEGANLARANLAGAYLEGANLARAYLEGAYLADANLARANLEGANLARAYLEGAYLARANLEGAYLARANLEGASYGKDVPLENIPLQLQGTKYNILVMDAHIKIGCKLFKHSEWEAFDDDQISRMDGGALEWWEEWKGFVLSLSLGHQQRIQKKKQSNK